jgi:hypothetical protein
MRMTPTLALVLFIRPKDRIGMTVNFAFVEFLQTREPNEDDTKFNSFIIYADQFCIICADPRTK